MTRADLRQIKFERRLYLVNLWLVPVLAVIVGLLIVL
jgi:paraquat-inducible protein B